jgi:ethanolamine utilization protein EutQ (cupin superfamily)
LDATEMAWTPNYDEIVTVLSGELIIEQNGEELTAAPGDMFLIRYGAEIVYRTRTRCAFSWVLSPANWMNLRWPE